MEKKLLEIGDELAGWQYGSYTGDIEKITRVTNSSAFSDRPGHGGGVVTTRFKREVSGTHAQLIGGGSFSPSYKLITDEVRTDIHVKAERRKLEGLINRVSITSLSDDHRKTLIEIFSSYVK